MATLEPVLVVPDGAIAQTSMHELGAACVEQMRAGSRLVTLYGRKDENERVIVTAVLLHQRQGLSVLRARGRQDGHYPAVTAGLPAAHIFERELWEQTGLTPTGHPWLKPVRFEGPRQTSMTEYPFFVLTGKEVHEVGVGPIHAGVIEPGHFRFMCLGEQVHHLEIQLGYQHRGVESLLLRRPALSLTPLIETIAGDTSIAYAWAYCAAMEGLGGSQASDEVERVRGVALELERIAMHLAGLAGLTTDIAFLQGASTYGRLRTAVINASMRVCGSRFGRAWLRPGGVQFGLSDEVRKHLLAMLSAFTRDFEQVNELVLGSLTVRDRFQGVGTVTRRAAEELGLVGMAARACGVPVDTRVSLPGRLYESRPASSHVETTGDCWARMCLRMREITASVTWICDVLQDSDSDLATVPRSRLSSLQPSSICISMREGWRGEVVHALETDADGKLLHYKVQDPSMINWFGLALAVRDNEISDFPICNKSFDLSYCGNDL
jgi:Ni,Fe-hydrogenase III large subunit